MAKFVLRIDPRTRFATYGRFQEVKNERKSPKTSKTDGFWRFFFGRVHPRQKRIKCQKLKFFAILVCPNLSPRLVLLLSKGKRFRNGRMIRFETYGGSKLDEIGPDDLLCYIRPFQSHREASSDGFRGVSEGSEAVPFLEEGSKIVV